METTSNSYPIIVVFTKYFKSDNIKNGEMDGAGGTYGGKKNCMQKTGGKTRSSKVGVGGRITLKCILKK